MGNLVGAGGHALAAFLGAGQTTVFNATAFDAGGGAGWTYGNSTAGRSPWAKMGRANAANGKYGVFAGGNGNNHNVQIYDATAARCVSK